MFFVKTLTGFNVSVHFISECQTKVDKYIEYSNKFVNYVLIFSFEKIKTNFRCVAEVAVRHKCSV